MSSLSLHTLRYLNLLACLTLFIGMSGCSSKPAEDHVLRVQMSSEPASLDPALAEDGSAIRVLGAMMQGLMVYNSDGRLENGLAENVAIEENGRVYVITIKPAVWSDGRPVQADDFVYSIRRNLDPTIPGKLADLLYFIKGARQYKKGLVKDFTKVGVQALSDLKIRFELESPVLFFPHILALTVALPQRQQGLNVSTGPYVLSQWKRDQHIELKKNPHFVGMPEKAPESIVFRFVAEESAALNLFENGQLDLLTKVSPLEIERLRSRNVVHEFPYFATYYIGFNYHTKPWSEAKWRKAVALSIDRDAIVQTIKGEGKAATSWIPAGFPGSNPSIGLKFDPRLARSALAGVPLSDLAPSSSTKKTSTSFELGYDSGARNQLVVEKIQADLRTSIGIKLKLTAREWKTYIQELSQQGTNPNHHKDARGLFRFGWLAPFVDAYASLMLFRSNNSNNHTGWKNADYDRLLDRIAATSEGAVRQEYIDAAQKILLEKDVVVVPVFHYTQSLIVSPRLENLKVNGLGLINFTQITIKPKN